MLGHADVVTAARNLMERTDPATAGLWPRATALLARQALEAALDDFWKVRSPGVEHCSMRAQLLCLPFYLQAPHLRQGFGWQASLEPRAPGDQHLAERVSYAWAGLSRACHQHPYVLPPTSAELIGWLAVTEQLIVRVNAMVSSQEPIAADAPQE